GERDADGPPVPLTRVLLPGARGGRGAAAVALLGGRSERAAAVHGADRVAARRADGELDVPLPHPRAPRLGDDGALRRGGLSPPEAGMVRYLVGGAVNATSPLPGGRLPGGRRSARCVKRVGAEGGEGVENTLDRYASAAYLLPSQASSGPCARPSSSSS